MSFATRKTSGLPSARRRDFCGRIHYGDTISVPLCHHNYTVWRYANRLFCLSFSKHKRATDSGSVALSMLSTYNFNNYQSKVKKLPLLPCRLILIPPINDLSRSQPKLTGQFNIILRIVQTAVIDVDTAMPCNRRQLEVA